MMTLKLKKETRLGPEYQIVYDYNNPYDRNLHYLMLGIEAMINCVPSGPVTKPEVRTYEAHVPEFIPGCFCQYVQFEKIWTPHNGTHVSISIEDWKTLYPIDGIVSPIDYIESCKCRVLATLLFDGYDCAEFQCKSNERMFNELRNWIYAKFGYNARNNVWRDFEQQVAQEIRRKYPTKEDFAAYVKKAAEASLKESGITPDMSYYDDRLKSKVCQYSKGTDKFYQE